MKPGVTDPCHSLEEWQARFRSLPRHFCICPCGATIRDNRDGSFNHTRCPFCQNIESNVAFTRAYHLKHEREQALAAQEQQLPLKQLRLFTT